MKKPVVLLSLFSFFVIASTAYAQGFVPLAPIPGLTDISPTATIDSATFAKFFNNLYKFCIGLSAALAVIMIIWGGLEISTQDSISKQGAGRERITQAILGLILVLSPVLVFSIINPSILNLSVTVPKIDLNFAPAIQPSILGTVQTCNAGSGQTNCVVEDQTACRAAGGTPQTREGGVAGSQTITCVRPNPTSVPEGNTMTMSDCVGQPTNGNGLPIVTKKTCSTATPSELQGMKNCRNLVDAGVSGICIW